MQVKLPAGIYYYYAFRRKQYENKKAVGGEVKNQRVYFPEKICVVGITSFPYRNYHCAFRKDKFIRPHVAISW
jgi:hypothetical protein